LIQNKTKQKKDPLSDDTPFEKIYQNDFIPNGGVAIRLFWWMGKKLLKEKMGLGLYRYVVGGDVVRLRPFRVDRTQRGI